MVTAEDVVAVPAEAAGAIGVAVADTGEAMAVTEVTAADGAEPEIFTTANQHGAESQGTLRIPAGMAWLLRFLPDTLGAVRP